MEFKVFNKTLYIRDVNGSTFEVRGKLHHNEHDIWVASCTNDDLAQEFIDYLKKWDYTKIGHSRDATA